MKYTTQKILLSLYSTNGTYGEGVTVSVFFQLLPELSQSGLRSLLYLLEKSQRVSSEKVGASTYFYLTKKGESELINQFPALKPKSQGELTWQCIVFKSAPKGDEQFRYLRSVLVSSNAFMLCRGVYAQPGGFTSKVLELCRTLYVDSLFLFTVAEWELGVERSVVTRNFGLADLVSAYSGISTELFELLQEIKERSSLSDQHKMRILTAFDRFRELLKEDTGLLPYFFPQVEPVSELQARFSLLFRKYFT